VKCRLLHINISASQRASFSRPSCAWLAAKVRRARRENLLRHGGDVSITAHCENSSRIMRLDAERVDNMGGQRVGHGLARLARFEQQQVDFRKFRQPFVGAPVYQDKSIGICP
jgi:hypothetical protein